jgi:hypothetical protein
MARPPIVKGKSTEQRCGIGEGQRRTEVDLLLGLVPLAASTEPGIRMREESESLRLQIVRGLDPRRRTRGRGLRGGQRRESRPGCSQLHAIAVDGQPDRDVRCRDRRARSANADPDRSTFFRADLSALQFLEDAACSLPFDDVPVGTRPTIGGLLDPVVWQRTWWKPRMLGIALRDEPSENTLGDDIGVETRASPIVTTGHCHIVTSFGTSRKRRSREAA